MEEEEEEKKKINPDWFNQGASNIVLALRRGRLDRRKIESLDAP